MRRLSSAGMRSCKKPLASMGLPMTRTTSIDQAVGIVNLTIVLARVSEEWIASDWPLRAISETATPHRIVAALTCAPGARLQNRSWVPVDNPPLPIICDLPKAQGQR